MTKLAPIKTTDVQKNTFNDEYLSYLFIHVFYDLVSSSKKKSKYSKLHCARLLRFLLLDEKSAFLSRISEITEREVLFVMVEPEKPIDVRSTVPDYIRLPDLNNFPPGLGFHVMRLNEYLASFCGMVAKRSFTVEDVIKRVGYKLGGLHLQKVIEGELEKDLLAEQSMIIFGQSFFAHSISNITSTVIMALAPVADEVQRRHPEFEQEIRTEYT